MPRRVCMRLPLVLCTPALADAMAAAEPLKGISYGPVPLKERPEVATALPQDDWMSEEAVPMWGPAGRGDLKIIKAIGANAIRLYGNNPHNGHSNFLDQARQEGLSVIPGMSDWPYFQQGPGSCIGSTDFNCFSQIKPLYLENLRNGFLAPNRTYHSALRVVNLLNEPDLKMPPSATNGGEDGPVKMCRSIISAFDAMLEAEKEAQVSGPLINFTATFSYAVCQACKRFGRSPALGQIWQLDDAMRNPQLYGYTPINNITAAYKARWTHSFNTANPATDMEAQFLNDYVANFPRTPVYIGEYHKVGADQMRDVGLILDIARRVPLFQGISFFQFQVAYWKGASEMEFGMFGLSDRIISPMHYFGKTYNVYCLEPVNDTASGVALPDAVASSFGGRSPDTATLCGPNPLGVPLNGNGYAAILAQNDPTPMARYVERVVEHLGATVVRRDELNAFAARFSTGSTSSFVPMMAELGARPSWMSVDPQAKCIADRTAGPATVGRAVGWACSQAQSFSCSEILDVCQNHTYTTADYVFSRYYEELGPGIDPLRSCSFRGAALLAAREKYQQWTGAAECVAGASPHTTLTTTTPQVHHDDRANTTTTEAGPSSTASGGSPQTTTTADDEVLNAAGRPGSGHCLHVLPLLALLVAGCAGA
mmetsp:Transcript_89130/g.252563  ORF Transcript_89130/g.252563 Transcript_89130/m.252563 type:complete len:653 (-) Transcript_89130:468-2426(-)